MIYVVKDSKGNTVALCSDIKDAEAYLKSAAVDKTTYTIETIKNKEEK